MGTSVSLQFHIMPFTRTIHRCETECNTCIYPAKIRPKIILAGLEKKGVLCEQEKPRSVSKVVQSDKDICYSSIYSTAVGGTVIGQRTSRKHALIILIPLDPTLI